MVYSAYQLNSRVTIYILIIIKLLIKKSNYSSNNNNNNNNNNGGGLAAESHPALCDPMDCSIPGSSVQGISRQEYWSE